MPEVTTESSDKIYVPNQGMPLSVFNDRYSRKHRSEDRLETYEERITGMVEGNFALTELNRQAIDNPHDKDLTLKLALKGVLPMSGRHIQHGDLTQASRNMEVFTNCSTTPFSFMLILLLLNGSGVGRDYSSESCRVNWDFMPNIRIVLNGGPHDDGDIDKGAHPDFKEAALEFTGGFDSLRDAIHKYDSESEDVRWIKVRDSREGWAEVVAILETAAFHKNHADSLFIFDFSDVRCRGSKIKGMQDRIAQGPIPLMRALLKVATIKGAGMRPWKQALFIDHYLADCVVMGNVRRAARMATKFWKDRDILEFIEIKRGGYLQSANNSVVVDEEFWAEANDPRPSHGRRVFEAVVGSAYFDRTGEPGFINAHNLNHNMDGADTITAENYLDDTCGLRLHPKTTEMIEKTLSILKKSKHPFITNPCGEIVLSKWGGYCVIGDICLAKVDSTREFIDACRMSAQFLVRTNLMQSMYKAEVDRTNRIGVGLTGIHEFYWKQFGLTFREVISAYDHVFDNRDEPANPKIMEFWRTLAEGRKWVQEAATMLSRRMKRNPPHTFTTIKPSGTISKVMNCTEGAHLPAYRFYMRWVIFPKGGEKHLDFERRGYPVQDVSHEYKGSVVVGFPTKSAICDVMPPEKVVTADEATFREQYQWLRLLERFWLGEGNNQVSYTMKFNFSNLSYHEFAATILRWQGKIRCCSWMPSLDDIEGVYAYTPEEPITAEEYQMAMDGIRQAETEGYNESMLECASGACPI